MVAEHTDIVYSLKSEVNVPMTTTNCCAECGVVGGASLKTCKSCMDAKYCDATCQRNHWPMHKKECKLRAAELRDEALFKDPPAKEDCPICFLPMPAHLICCVSLPPATVSAVPIDDLRMQIMKSCKERLRYNIIHAAGRSFAEDVITPSVCLQCLEIKISVHFVIPTEVVKQLKTRKKRL